MTDFPSDNAIDETLDEIFRLPEFYSASDEISAQLNSLIGNILIDVFWGDHRIFAIVILVVLCVLLTVFAIFLIRWGLRRRRLSDPISVTKKETEADLWLRCMAFAEKGAFEKAIVILFVWYLQFLGSRGLITIEKGKTNFQYELELSRNAYGKIDRFRAFKTIFAAVRYGGKDIGREDFEGWRSFCQEASA